MKIIFPKHLCTMLMLVFCMKYSCGQKAFANLTNVKDSTFGYTAQNPLKLKKGNQGKSIEYTYKFLSGLKTIDNQNLIFLFRKTANDPAFKEPAIRLYNKYTGMPLNGKLGILDIYVFATSATKDTLNLYVDIYNKGNLFIPIGLKYEQKQ